PTGGGCQPRLRRGKVKKGELREKRAARATEGHTRAGERERGEERRERGERERGRKKRQGGDKKGKKKT
ncbi:hypothetical protein, partial [Klebsiella pneumoniae]|uniref:hypothetical protein n=1 Tax=Klebsiella pneumoniae TaxID=573 RepID=UPI001C68BCCF